MSTPSNSAFYSVDRVQSGPTVVTTADGSLTMSHGLHGECYHSRAGARLEAERLYIDGSDLIESLKSSRKIRVLDVGLGLGYNAIATISAWLAAPTPPPMTITSLEIDADLVQSLTSGNAPWQTGWDETWRSIARKLNTGTPIQHHHHDVVCNWNVLIGDARETLPQYSGLPFTHVWQDAFSPSTNPQLWCHEWFKTLASYTEPGAILMSYSVARSVKDALTQTGWEWQRIPATGCKRHWLRAIKAISALT